MKVATIKRALSAGVLSLVLMLGFAVNAGAYTIYYDHDSSPYPGSSYGNDLPIGITSYVTAYFTELAAGTQVSFEQCSGVQPTIADTIDWRCLPTGDTVYTAGSDGVLNATVPVSYDFYANVDPNWNFCGSTTDGSFPEYQCYLNAHEVSDIDPLLTTTSLGLYFVDVSGGGGNNGGGNTTGPLSKDDCKKNGWMEFSSTLGFKNQGQCISYVNHL